MCERIRVEVTETGRHGRTTYAAEALSYKDAAQALAETVEEYEDQVIEDG